MSSSYIEVQLHSLATQPIFFAFQFRSQSRVKFAIRPLGATSFTDPAEYLHPDTDHKVELTAEDTSNDWSASEEPLETEE